MADVEVTGIEVRIRQRLQMFLLQREALFRRFFELAKFPFVSHIGYPLLQLLINMSEAVEPAVPDEEVLPEVFHHPLNLTFCSGPAWTACPWQEVIVVNRNRRRRYSSYCGEIGPAPDNLIARDFKAEQPNQKWLTDITEFQLPAGKVWLSPVVDCFDGKVVSWSLSTRPDAELINTMLGSAVETLNAGERPVIHSDRGGHYRWPGWLERVNAAGLIRSMSRKGCSPDNAACEGFFGRLKTEMYYGRKWSGITPEKFIQHVDTYIRWYNERRIKLSLGAVSPKMYRQQCGLE